MSSAQQAYVASAARLARMMSPAQLSARSDLVGAEIENFSNRNFDETEYSSMATSSNLDHLPRYRRKILSLSNLSL